MAAPNSTYEVVVNIIYKRTPDLTFDVQYLIQTHIPMVTKVWGPHGLLGATVTEAPADSDYAFIIAARFKSLEEWQKATSEPDQMGPLMADVANFTNGTADFVVGTVVKGGLIEVP